MVKLRETRRERSYGGLLTALSYLFALIFALIVVRLFAPGLPYKSAGVHRVKVPYLTLELPLASAGAAEGPLARAVQGEEDAGLGLPHTAVMKRRRLTPGEYARWVKDWPWEGEHLFWRAEGVRYEIYFVPTAGETTRIPIPAGYGYTVTGNGSDGFVVAVWQRKAGK